MPVASSKEGDAAPLLDALQEEKETRRCCQDNVRKLLLNSRNPDFALNMELTLRAATAVTILGLPFIIPPGRIQALDDFKETGMFTPAVIFFCVFNLGRSLGQTLMQCSYGLRGATIAVLQTWVLYWFFPHSVTKDSPAYVFWIGLIDGVVFISLMLLLNLNMSTKIFSIANFVGWWMAFLIPGDDHFHFPGSEDWNPWKDQGLACLVRTSLGACCAISASLLPYPMLDLHSSVDLAKDIASDTPKVWTLMIQYMGRADRNAYVQDQVYRNLKRTAKSMSTFPGLVDNAWWECVGLGRGQRIRRKLRLMAEAMVDTADCLQAVWGASTDVTWNEKHSRLMESTKSQMLDCVTSGGKLLTLCWQITARGVLSNEDGAKLGQLQREVQECDKFLARTFTKVRRDMGLANAKLDAEADTDHTVLSYVMLPHILAFNVSCWLNVVFGLAEALKKGQSNPSSLPLADIMFTWGDLVKDTANKENLNFVLRAMLSICGGFTIGYFGYGDLIAPGNAGIAVTCAVLLSKFTGSAIVKNLGRVQGVALGMVVGNIIKSFFDSCALVNVIPLSLAAFAYATAMLFVWHTASPQYSFVGSLAACFGLSMMYSGDCTPVGQEIKIDKEGTYDSILTNVCACMIIVVVDVFVGPGRASKAAVTSLYDVLGHIEKTITLHFDNSVGEVPERTQTLRDVTDLADELSEHAANEPRLWRTRWKGETFEYTLARLHHVRFSLHSLETCMSEGFTKGGARNAVLQSLLSTKSFPQIGEFMLKKIAVVKKLASLFENETVVRLQALGDDDVKQEFREDAQKMTGQLVKELAAKKALLPPGKEEANSMREDGFSQICMTFGAIQGVFRDLRLIQHGILREC